MLFLLAAHGAHMNPFAMPGLAGAVAHFSSDKFLPAASGMGWQQSQRMRPRKPGLFVIGAMKSGTTYLNKLLGAHPAIFMCTPEEPTYFIDPEQLRDLWPEAWDLGFWRSEAHYLRLFQDCGDALYLGEASTNYTKRPLVSGVPERLYEFNPEARFIYLMRDPIERTISHYWHMVRYHAEQRPMLEAIQSDPQYLDVSHYAMQLTPWLDLFGPDSVAILTFEHLTHDPVGTMRLIYEWLCLDPSQADISGFARPENVTPDTLRMATRHGVLQCLRQSRPGRLLTPYLPWGLRQRALRMATRAVDRRMLDSSAVVDFLRPIQQRQTEALVRLVGREFPEWTTLHGDRVAPALEWQREVLHES